MDKVGRSAERTGKQLGKFGVAAGVGMERAGEAVVKFAATSIRAYADAERQSGRLDVALQKFPKTADITRKGYDDLAKSIQAKTRFDDDSATASEAVLAGFNLTGKQIVELLPKVADLAEKMGTDLPTAARNVGLATLGQTRALKAAGITLPTLTASSQALAKAQRELDTSTTSLTDKKKRLSDLYTVLSAKTNITVADQVRFKNAQDAVRHAEDRHATALGKLKTAQDAVAASGSRVVGVSRGLNQLNGQAEKGAQSTSGKVDQLKNNYQNLQESIGAKLVPAMTTMVNFTNTSVLPAISGLAGFLGDHSTLLKGIGLLAGAFVAAKFAMAGLQSVQVLVADYQAAFAGKAALATAAMDAEGAAAAGAAGRIGLLSRGLGAAALAFGVYEAAKTASSEADAKKFSDPVFAGINKQLKAQGAGVDVETLISTGKRAKGPSYGYRDDLRPVRGAQGVDGMAVVKHVDAVAKKVGPKIEESFADQFKIAGTGAGNALAQAAADALASKLQSLKDAAASLRDSIADALKSPADITNLMNPGKGAGNITVFLRDHLKQLTGFQHQLATLRTKGLSAPLLQQIASAGVDKGGPLARALLGSSNAQITHINALNASISKQASTAGSVVATATYSKEIAALTRQQTVQLGAIHEQLRKVTTEVSKHRDVYIDGKKVTDIVSANQGKRTAGLTRAI